ncbi:MAG: phosphoribosylformylglycinamidine cyclo-ligase [Flavonifractor sp.]|nr:phosphoribosylformylglycinamidine cyclo-ligase [Flavonifractor sp.]MCI9473552.1 phosphoribosylformylglycinamidine cyclo-ligase [Flavonifractor sp.]
MNDSHSASYAAAGVDVTAGYEAVNRIKPLVESTYIPGVMGTLGGFGGLFAPDVAGMERPLLVSGTDGVGTKLKLAFLMDKHDTVGIDCVAMCVNDIICSGAMPLFFLDYLAVGKNKPERIEAIVAGVTEGCRQAGCALIGGETAEMPGFYPEEEYDLAGFSVGLVDQAKMIDGSALQEGDLLIGLGSNGVHSNGFSLVRKVLNITSRAALDIHVSQLGHTLGEELLRPTRIYVRALRCLRQQGVTVKAVSHITGGGLYENVPRMMKDGLTARIQKSAFPVPPIFEVIQRAGEIPERDMYNTFNMGIGLVIAIPNGEVGAALDVLTRAGEQAYVIGSVVKGDDGVVLV